MTNDTAERRSMAFTVREIRARNAELGHYFFQPESMRFFASRILRDCYPAADGSGTYFVTSEQFRPVDGAPHARLYTVRLSRLDGSIDTVGEFQAFATARAAKAHAKRLASGASV